jgi:hypothetical protein
MKIIFVFFLFFLALVYTQSTVKFSVTKLTTSSSGSFRTRSTRGRLVNNSRAVGGAITSVARTKVNGEVDYDGVRFAAFAINAGQLLPGVAPTCSSAFFTHQADAMNNTAAGDGITYDITRASNFVALRFYSLEEIDPTTNNSVNTIRLNSLTWSLTNSSATNTDSPIDVPFVTIAATANGNIPIEINFIATANLINVTIPNLNGNVIVPPKGIETIFAVDLTKYTYANSNNYIRLVTFTSTGNTQRQINVTSPNPNIPLRFSFLNSSSNGVPANVRFDLRALHGNNILVTNPNITVGYTDNTIFNGTDVSLQISSFFGANVVLTRTDIPFAAGFQGPIVYDPAIDFGIDPTTTASTNFAPALSISMVLLFVCAILSFF